MSRFLAWHRMPVTLADGSTAPLRPVLEDLWWYYVRNGPVENWWFGMLDRVLDRFATDRARHLAFLAGADFARGFGRPGGYLSYLSEYTAGNEMAIEMERLTGGPAEMDRLAEQYELEHSRWARRQWFPVRPS